MQAATAEAYRTLDLQPGADLGSVRHAYRLLVKVWHPDRFGHDSKLLAICGEKLKDINASYEAIVAYLSNGLENEQAPRSGNQTYSKPPGVSSAAELYKSGLELYYDCDRTQAEQLFLQAAERGDARAQYAYGYLLYESGYVPLEANQHFAKILRWWTRAADQGHVEAQFMVGTFHQLQLGTPFNEPKALRWLKLAASQGHQGAHRWLRNIISRKLHILPLPKLVFEPPEPPPRPS